MVTGHRSFAPIYIAFDDSRFCASKIQFEFRLCNPKPTWKRSDRRHRELHPDFYRRSCSRRLSVVISIKGFDSPFVRTTTPALEDGASTTAARKPGFSPL